MQVTDAMVAKAAEVAYLRNRAGNKPWDDLSPEHKSEWCEKVRPVITAALAEMWQSIDSAPKDGTPVLLGWELLHPLVGHCEGATWGTLTSNFGFEPFNNAPTAWQPLPPPPMGK